MRVAVARCLELPEPDPDEAPLVRAFARRGVEAIPLAWDDPSADAFRFDAVVLRATWNYHLQPEKFLAWAEEVARITRLLNPIHVVRWNIHKSYLAELRSRGFPIVPTVFLNKGERADLRSLISERGWREVVLKPAISASSFRTRRFARSRLAEAQRYLDGLLEAGDAMVQEFMESVEQKGERSLVWIGGHLSHAVRKLPRLEGDRERVVPTEAPTEAEVAWVSRLLAPFGDDVLYARIDVIRGNDGRQRISELELIEPSLFFEHSAGSADRFVEAVVARARG